MGKENELLEKVAEILDIKRDSLSMSYKIEEDMLDSLGVLALSAAIDEVYDKVVSVTLLRNVRQVSDIFDLIREMKDE